MKHWIAGCLAALSICAVAGAAQASVYDFSYDAGGGPSGQEFGHGSIVLSNTETDGYYEVLGIQGYANHSKIEGLSDYAGADNLVFVEWPFVDQGGISFSTKSGIDYNIFSLNNLYAVLSSKSSPSWPYALASNASPLKRLCITYVSSAVPEPSTWLFMILGIGLLGTALRRRTPQGSRGGVIHLSA